MLPLGWKIDVCSTQRRWFVYCWAEKNSIWKYGNCIEGFLMRISVSNGTSPHSRDVCVSYFWVKMKSKYFLFENENFSKTMPTFPPLRIQRGADARAERSCKAFNAMLFFIWTFYYFRTKWKIKMQQMLWIGSTWSAHTPQNCAHTHTYKIHIVFHQSTRPTRNAVHPTFIQVKCRDVSEWMSCPRFSAASSGCVQHERNWN